MLKKVESYLFCMKCDEETRHTVLYMDNKIQRIKCGRCSSTYGIDQKKLLELYTLSTAEHIITEPFKLNKEIKEKGLQFLFSIPRRLFTKPVRVIKDYKDIIQE